MFAHQVIEDLQNKNNKIDKFYDYWIPFCIKLIKKAQRIHVGDMYDLHSSFKSWDRKRTLFMDSPKYIRLPYDITWIDGTAENYPFCQSRGMTRVSKEAVLAVNLIPGNERFIACFIFSYIDHAKQWILFPMMFVISVGSYFTRNDVDIVNKWIGSEQLQYCGNDAGNIKVLYLHSSYASSMTRDQFKIEVDSCQINLQLLDETLRLMNCKNITTENHKPPEALNKARRKKGKQELLTYKTLKLLLPGKKEKHDLVNDPTSEHNRIHLCRGHFKEYTADAPLFGRITGLWWWQAHVRGQNKDGVVMKDYEIRGY